MNSENAGSARTAGGVYTAAARRPLTLLPRTKILPHLRLILQLVLGVVVIVVLRFRFSFRFRKLKFGRAGPPIADKVPR